MITPTARFVVALAGQALGGQHQVRVIESTSWDEGHEMSRTCRTTMLVLAVLAIASIAPAPAGAANWQITISPSTGLTDGQSVLVTGTGFTEHPLTQFVVDWAVIQCNSAVLNQPIDPVLVASNCDIATTPFTFVHADDAGNVSVGFRVSTTIPTGVSGPTVDCLTTQCALIVAQITDAGFVGAAAPISFAPAPHCPRGERPGHGYGDTNHCHRFRTS